MTIPYYDRNGQQFFDRSVNIDMSDIKRGEGELFDTNHWLFAFYTEKIARALIEMIPELTINDLFIIEDRRPELASEFWINMIIRRQS